MATTKKTARKGTANKKPGARPKRAAPVHSSGATELSYNVRIQLQVILFTVLSMIFLMLAIVKYS